MTIPVETGKKATAVQEDASKNKPALPSFKPSDLISLAICGWFVQQATEKLLHSHFIWAAILAAIGMSIGKKPLKKLLRKLFPNKDICCRPAQQGQAGSINRKG